MDKLSLILDYLKENKIVCPLPIPWKDLWEKVDGWEEFFEVDDIFEYKPLVMGGWVHDKETKNRNFINLIEYLYKNNPKKFIFVEEFVYKNNEWLKWDDDKRSGG